VTEGPNSQDRLLAKTIEAISLKAWPAAREFTFDGWLLRFSGGYTGRANSINVLKEGEIPLGQKFIWCEGTYREQKLPCLFRFTSIDETEHIQEALHARTYKMRSPTMVEVLESLPEPGEDPPGWKINVGQPGEWLTHFRRMDTTPENELAPQEALLNRISAPNAFAWIELGGQAVACGQVIITDGYAGLFDLVTDTAFRRQGLGRQMVQGLLNWAVQNGAKGAYLQVLGENVPARGLYKKMGFRHLYDYQYWQTP